MKTEKTDNKIKFSYQNVETLKPYIDSFGKILPAQVNKLSTKEQKVLAREVKRARHLALLPFVA